MQYNWKRRRTCPLFSFSSSSSSIQNTKSNRFCLSSLMVPHKEVLTPCGLFSSLPGPFQPCLSDPCCGAVPGHTYSFLCLPSALAAPKPIEPFFPQLPANSLGTESGSPTAAYMCIGSLSQGAIYTSSQPVGHLPLGVKCCFHRGHF